MGKINEACGVFGIYNNSDCNVVSASYYAMFALQHRGQQSCGMAVNNDGIISCYKDLGLASEVFDEDTLHSIENGKMAVAHVCLDKSSLYAHENTQPQVVNHLLGNMALVFNGSLTNSSELRDELELKGSIFHSTCDAEIIAYVITQERLSTNNLENAVINAMKKLKGAYSFIVMSSTKLIAARDPNGFHPLCMGDLDRSVVFASETCALDSIGAKFTRDVAPGEVVVVDKSGIKYFTENCQSKSSLCVFEYIYFARPDSIIDGASVHLARQNAGKFLAKQHPVDADIVIGVPDSGLDAALGYANESGIPYGVGFIKNRYIARTFIQPTQQEREQKVRIKLNAMSATVKGKRVVLVDDSIVRGTTCAKIVKLLRAAGASEVHMRISSPPFLYPCYYGTDIDSQDKLIACKYSIDEIANIIGVDTLGYLNLDSVKKIAEGVKCGLCDACFSGNYPTYVPSKISKPRALVKLSERVKKDK